MPIRIEKYHIKMWNPDGTGEVRENVFGVVWTHKPSSGPEEYYFDEFPDTNARVNWVQRFNEDPDNVAIGRQVSARAELFRVLGDKMAFSQWKREYARKRLPRISNYICMTNKKFAD